MLIQVGVAFKSTKHGVRSAVFECSCGRRKVMMLSRVRRGFSKTCGLCNSIAVRPVKKSRLKIAWQNMIARCTKVSNPDYKNYGARGITISKEWLVFAAFAADMGEPPRGMTLERIDNAIGYCKENCRWATYTQQARNKRNNSHVVVNGKKITIAEAAEIIGVDRRRVRKYLRAS